MRPEIHVRKLHGVPDGKLHSVRIERLEGGYRVESGRPGAGATLVRGPEARVWSVVTEDGRSFEALVERGESEIEVAIGTVLFRFATKTPTANVVRRGSAPGRIEVKSPMPGKVVEVLVSPGASVTAGQPVLLFEAMKMQNELRSPEDGVVAEVAVEAGQAIEARERLYVLVPSPK
ncbi:MAG TPA: biotin/lipoyl-containing protein [Vicinamibacteria bacterium]|nr:biotin/lipoyl-containing protein [Vicinamibacteria bacterium]